MFPHSPGERLFAPAGVQLITNAYYKPEAAVAGCFEESLRAENEYKQGALLPDVAKKQKINPVKGFMNSSA